MSELDLSIVSSEQASIINTRDVGEVVKTIQERSSAITQIKAAVLSLCSPKDIHDFNGKPYVAESACNKIKGPMQVEMKNLRVEKVDHGEGIYEYQATMEARCNVLGTDWEEYVGSRHCMDPFFKGQFLDGVLDPGDVRKAAVANCRGHCVRKSCGLENLTWEMIRASGLNADSGGARVQYDTSRSEAQKQYSSSDMGDTSRIEPHIELRSFGPREGSEALVKIEKLKCITGSKNGKSWTKVAVTVTGEHGREDMGTFDWKVGGVLLASYNEKTEVTIWYTREGQYYTINSAERRGK